MKHPLTSASKSSKTEAHRRQSFRGTSQEGDGDGGVDTGISMSLLLLRIHYPNCRETSMRFSWQAMDAIAEMNPEVLFCGDSLIGVSLKLMGGNGGILD